MNNIINNIKIVIFTLAIPIFTMGMDIDIDVNKISSKISKDSYIVLFLHKDFCGYCERLEDNLDSETIDNIIEKNFIKLSVNRDDDDTILYQDFVGTNQEFLNALGVDFYPALVFIDNKNQIIFNTSGYRNIKKLKIIFKYIKSKSYKDMDLEDFRDELLFSN